MKFAFLMKDLENSYPWSLVSKQKQDRLWIPKKM